MKNKKLYLGACLISLVGVLASCGPAASSTTSGGGSQTSAPTTSEGGEKSVYFEFWHTFSGKNLLALQSKIEEFHEIMLEKTGVDVTIKEVYQGTYDDVAETILKGFAGDNVPTMAIAYPDNVANFLDQAGKNNSFVYNLEDWVNHPEVGFGKQAYLGDEYGIEDFIPAFINEGKKYAVPGMYSLPYMKSSEVMFYNKDLLYALMEKIQPDLSHTDIDDMMKSITWDEFIELNKKIKAIVGDIAPQVEEPTYYDSDGNLFITQMYQRGIPYSEINMSTGKGKILYEEEPALTNAKAMVQGLKDAHDAGLFTTKGVEGTYGSESFTNIKAVFSIGSTGGTGYNMPQGGIFEVGVCRVPTADKDNDVYVSQGPTLTFLKNPGKTDAENDLRMKYAWQFAKFITNAKQNVDLCTYGSEGYVPVRYSAYESSDFQQWLTDNKDQIYGKTTLVIMNEINENFIETAAFKGSDTLRKYSGSIITDVLLGTKDIDGAFKTAINEAKGKMA